MTSTTSMTSMTLSRTPRAEPFFLALTFTMAALLAPVALLAATTTTTPGDVPEEVTYARDVAPILNAKCVRCHRPGEIAPMALQTYDEVRPWAKTIGRVVREGTMPPWHANPEFGVFKNDRSLSEHEAAVIDRWVKKGAKLGDPAELPEPPRFAEGWRLGEPDLIVTLEQVELGAGGRDVFKDLVKEAGLEADTWLRAVEVKPGNRKVVHHVILIASSGEGPPESGWLGAWAAGLDPMVFPPGTARLVHKGDSLIANMHYHPDAEPATDQTQIGLYFYDGEPQKELINLWVQNASFEIPAGAPNHEVRSFFKFTQDSTVYGLLPHMHYRGKDFIYTAHYPDGTSQTLLRVDAYDFNWQTLYELAEPLKMPAGSRIDCIAHYDNSTDNPNNPDPTRNVTFGNESYDEMMIGFVDYVVDDGLRPMSLAERLIRIRGELVLAHPGEVYTVELWEADEDGRLDTALWLPAGGGGTWYIPLQGQIYEAEVLDFVQSGSEVKAKLRAPFGTFEMQGEHAGGRVKGKVVLPFDDDQLLYEGALATTADGP